MNKQILRSLGFGKQIDRVERGNCPLCDKVINLNIEFRDKLSFKEFQISGFVPGLSGRYFQGGIK